MDKKNITIPAKKYSLIILSCGGAIVLLGALLSYLSGFVSALSKKAVFDLPILIIIIGVIIAAYGVSQFLRSNKVGGETVFTKNTVNRFFTNNAIFISLLVIIVFICLREPRFLQMRVMLDILAMSSPKLIIALGVSFSLLIAGVDLSAGRMVGLAAVVSTSMLQIPDYANRFWPNLPHLPVFLPIAIALLACMFFGTLSGFITARFNMHPFIATLAMQVIVYGANSLYFDTKYSKSQPIGGVRPDFTAIGQTRLFVVKNAEGADIFPGVSILVPIALIFCIIIWFVLNKTVFGKNVYAIGGNREAAIVSGVNVFKTTLIIFILGAGAFGIGGILEAARTAGATNNYGLGYELDAIAACVVGGVSLMGGIGKVRGIISGVLIFTVIQYGLIFISVSPYWQQIIKGIIIATAVAIDMSKYRRK
jgi:methyl-galactoside transport system permease protein